MQAKQSQSYIGFIYIASCPIYLAMPLSVTLTSQASSNELYVDFTAARK